MRESFCRWSFEFIHFVQWEWLMPFCPSNLPRQHKRLCIARSISSLPHFLAAGQTILNEKSTFSLSLSLTRADSSSRHTDISTQESTFNIWASSSFRRQFLINYFFLLNQLDLETFGWMLNSCSTIYSCFSTGSLQHKGSFCLKLLLKFPFWKLSIYSSTHLFFLLI